MSKVLILLTSHDALGETGHATGLYLPELVHPYMIFRDAGLEIECASPKGGNAPIDPNSISEDLKDQVDLAEDTLAIHTLPGAIYDAYFIVGGHGTMWDLPNNQSLATLLETAHSQQKPIAAVCHGPAALLNLKDRNGQSLLKGKQVTGFSNDEEAAIHLTKVVPFLLEDALIDRGSNYTKADIWEEHVVVDGNLITGQNPNSARATAQAVCKLLLR